MDAGLDADWVRCAAFFSGWKKTVRNRKKLGVIDMRWQTSFLAYGNSLLLREFCHFHAENRLQLMLGLGKDRFELAPGVRCHYYSFIRRIIPNKLYTNAFCGLLELLERTHLWK